MEDGKKPETQEPSFLEKVKAEREAMEKVLNENKNVLARMEDLKAEKMMFGNTDAGQNPEKPKFLTPKEYADAVMKGQIPGK